MRRRWLLVAAALVVIGVGLWLWQRGDDATTSTSTTRTRQGSGTAMRDAKIRAGDAPEWFAQRNVGRRRIAGIVLHDGKPVAGATVRLANQLTAARAITGQSITTDESGRFDFGP